MSQATTAAGTVLIADDNPEARRMLEMRVKREGHEILMAENGRQALDILAREPVDVVLLDIDMPELDGYAVLAAVRADPRLSHVPVLIISGGGDQDDLVRCIEMGAVDYLPKPFNQAVLRARISACVAQKRQRDTERVLVQGPPAPAGSTAVVPANATMHQTEQFPDPLALSSTASRGPVPARLGKIRVGRLLGSGGMGDVFLGHHELLDLPVAVKVLRPELTALPNARERFLREARMAVRLTHRNVVRLLEVGETEHGVHLAFEYVDGGTLAGWLYRQPLNRLPIDTAVRVTTEVAAALAAAHDLGIIHRDIKPANLLLTADGEVRVGDFGLAKHATAEPVADPLATAAGVVVGTPLYMAPEQLALGAPLDTRTDLYALGGVLYEMLVGHPPFGKLAPSRSLLDIAPYRDAALFEHVRHTAPVPPREARPDTPAWLDAVCLKLLAKSPADRFPTPAALLAALQGPA